MFRVLIVEDIKVTSTQLRHFLSESFADAAGRSDISVDTTETVSEGRRLIEDAFREDHAYHAVILDSNLPLELGSPTELDESLCLCVRQLTPATLVAHITAYLEDKPVQEHVTRVHLEQIDTRAITLSKLDIDFPFKLVKTLKAFLYGLQVEALMGELVYDGGRTRYPRGRATHGASLTHSLAALHRLAAAHWHDFDDGLRAKLNQIFDVSEPEGGSGNVRVTLWPVRRERRDDAGLYASPNQSFPELPHTYDSDHFTLHYGLRNPDEGPGLGADGVNDFALILVYADALEQLYRTMRRAPWNRPQPIRGKDRKTHVFVFNASAHSTVDHTNTPLIVLPSRSDETSAHTQLQRATAEAIHEATHVFNFNERPFDDEASAAWEWYDEAFAVFMEMEVLPGNHDYFRFLPDWVDRPELSLDDPRAKYQAGMFLRYLSEYVSPALVNKVWRESLKWEPPLEALSRLMASDRKAVAQASSLGEFFGTRYCLDLYFNWNQRGVNLFPAAFQRFGERAVSASFTLTPGQDAAANGVLDHLACRYYRINVRGGATQLQIRFYVGGGAGPGPLRALLVVVHRDKRRSHVIPLTSGSHAGMLFAEVSGLDVVRMDYVVLVVSNCGIRSSLNCDDGEHDDSRAFYFTVSTPRSLAEIASDGT